MNIEGSQILFSKNIVFLALNISFFLTNRAYPDETLLYAAFHLHVSIHCLPKYMYAFRGFYKGLTDLRSFFILFLRC